MNLTPSDLELIQAALFDNVKSLARDRRDVALDAGLWMPCDGDGMSVSDARQVAIGDRISAIQDLRSRIVAITDIP